MKVSFIRVYPNNKGAIQEIERPNEICRMALQFLSMGGWYTVEIKNNGMVRVSATDSQLNELVTGESSNGPSMHMMIDQIIRQSMNHLQFVRDVTHIN